MKIRTLIFKVKDIDAAKTFWQTLLETEPHKNFHRWKEFWCGNMRLGLLHNDFGDKIAGSGCVPVFEFPDDELDIYIQRAKKLGAKIVLDGLDNPQMRSIVFRDPFGHEFELSKLHD